MHPAFLDSMSWEMAEVYGSISDQILINLARHFPFYEYVSDVPTSAFAYQASMLAQMGQVNRETIQIIRNGLEDADLALNGVLEQAIMDAVKTSEPQLWQAVKDGIFKPAGVPVVSPNQYRAFNLYYTQAADKLNLVNTVMLESTKSAYQQAVSGVVAEIELADRMNRTALALDTAAGETITGVSSWNQAMRHATDRLKEGGITGFIDHAGRQWSAEAYVAMDIRTTVFNTARAATWETNQTFGNDLYSVSYHNGARPFCYPYQNMVISSTDRYGVTYDLDGNEISFIAQSATSYGQAAGLFGINCKHYPTPFIPGVSVINGQPQNPEENEKTYEESQEQRRLERKIREEKRDLEMLKAQGAPEEEIKAQREKVRKTSSEIDEFCNETGRARHRNREGVYTKRDFPDAKKYDVEKFEHDQQNLIRDYYKQGGEQQNYSFGQLTPNAPIVPNPAPTPTPTPTPAPAPTPTPAQTQQQAFTPAKTRTEAEEYAKKYAVSVNYGGNISLEGMNAINEELTQLNAKYPTNKLGRISNNGRLKTAVARANGGVLEVQGKRFVRSSGTYSVEEYRSTAKKTIESLEKRFPNGIPEAWQKTYKNAQETIKFTRWSVSSEYGHISATVPHEYGHIVSDQYFGMINKTHYCKDAMTPEALQKVQIVKDTFKQAKQNGDIYKISEYGSTNADEFFAESFAAKWMGEQLPDIVEEMLRKVL